jgi:hypothetical protein
MNNISKICGCYFLFLNQNYSKRLLITFNSFQSNPVKWREPGWWISEIPVNKKKILSTVLLQKQS